MGRRVGRLDSLGGSLFFFLKNDHNIYVYIFQLNHNIYVYIYNRTRKIIVLDV